MLSTGLLSARPTPDPLLKDRLYWATDDMEMYLDDGTAWTTIIPSDGPDGTAGLRTLGLNSGQAAAGTHGHNVMEEDMTQVADKNRIHEAAYLRQVLFQKFGANLHAFYPCNDSNAYVRDLMRRHPLTGGKTVLARQAGVIDYSLDMKSDHLSEAAVNRGALNTDIANRAMETATPIPAGRWKGFQFRSGQATNQTIYVGKADIDPADLATKALFSVTSVAGSLVSGEYNHTVTFPFVFSETGQGYWIYMPTLTVFSASVEDIPGKQWSSGTSTWLDDANLVTLLEGGERSYAWSSLSEFSLGFLLDVDDSPANGRAISIGDNSNEFAYVNVETDKKITARVRNVDPTDYTLSPTEILHGGFNMVVLTYKAGIRVGLYLNGEQVAITTPSAGLLTDADLNISVGARVKPDESVSNKLAGARISDIWMAEQYVDDADAHELYAALIQGFPMTIPVPPPKDDEIVIKHMMLEDPVVNDDLSFFFTDRALTIFQLNDAIQGSSTPSVTWNIRHSTARDDGSPNSLFSSNRATTSLSGAVSTSFDDPTIPAGSWVWLEVTAKAGTVDELGITIHAKAD